MSVEYILNQTGVKIGLNPNVSTDRSVLLRFLNEGARELYMQADLPGSILEQVFKVNGDQTITLPWYVGPIRGLREQASMQVWHLNQQRPRYNQFNWQDMWRNYRTKNKQALQTSIHNEAQLIITTPAVEVQPVVISILGTTILGSQIVETVTMNAVSKTTVNAWKEPIYSIKKDRFNNYDITVSDVDGMVLSVIPNCMKAAEYQVIDVSACPWLNQNTSPLDNYMELLFKQTLPYLFLDDQEFPANDYDDVVVNKMLQLWSEEQGKVELAKAYMMKATYLAGMLKQQQNTATEDCVALVANTHDTMLKRIGTGLRRRYSLYAGRKF